MWDGLPPGFLDPLKMAEINVFTSKSLGREYGSAIPPSLRVSNADHDYDKGNTHPSCLLSNLFSNLPPTLPTSSTRHSDLSYLA